MAGPASTERAWPTAPTGAPNFRPTPTMVGARTRSEAWEAIVARSNGMSRLRSATRISLARVARVPIRP